jgi:predicted RNA-binding protein with PIN domain
VGSAREYLLVDGHSIIFAWPELRRLQARRTAAARESLIKTLTDYQDQSGVRVVLVFDGRGARASEETAPDGIQVFYSPDGRTADDLIERLVAKYGAAHPLTVATSDLMEQQTAISFGAASCLSAEQLKTLLDRTERDFSRRLQPHRRKK